MKIAITGGSGFIGSRLKALLEQAGHIIVNIDIVDANPVDILDYPKLLAALNGCDAIYHLAAAHRDDIYPRSIYYDVNSLGTQNVIQAAKDSNINKIIFASTVAVYGLNAGQSDEMQKPNPFNDYGKSKLEAETHLQAWAGENDNYVLSIVRPVVVFGENNRGNVYNLMTQISNNRFMMIGQGQNRKSMAYVGNVAAFFAFCLDQKKGVEIYNYSDKPDLTTQALIDTIYNKMNKKRPSLTIPYWFGLMAGYGFDVLGKLRGKPFSISAIRIKKFCSDTIVDAQKAHKSGFKPSYSLEDGIKNMISHDFKNFK